jgi:hypothetical protein
MVSELEVWRAARLLVGQYADDALEHAEKRAASLRAKADLDGWATWTRIAAAILENQQGRSASNKELPARNS